MMAASFDFSSMPRLETERPVLREVRPAEDLSAMIGTAVYNQWHQRNNSAEIGYDLKSELWGRGLMSEALRAMLGFGFDEMALNRIEADVTVGNEASVRVLDKLGFQQEGLLRQRGFWRGSYHDLLLFSLLRSDWAATTKESSTRS